MLQQQQQLSSWRGQAGVGASEPSAAGGGERASADVVVPAAGVAAVEGQSEGASDSCAPQQGGGEGASAVGVAQAAGASEPSAALPAEESGEVSGTAPVLGDLAYATGEWAQWSHHQGYKELLEVLAQWESAQLPRRKLPTEAFLRSRLLKERQEQAARPSSCTPEGAERAEELQRAAKGVLAELGQSKRHHLRRLLCAALHLSQWKVSAKDMAGAIVRRLVELMAEAEAQECDTRPYPRTSPKTVLLFWCMQEATRAQEAEVERRVLRPGNPLEDCYEEGDNLLQQTLRQAKSGLLGKAQRRRLEHYRRHLDVAFMREHAEAVREALLASSGLPVYVAGSEIQGEVLREFEAIPILTAPLVCMLCAPGASGPECSGASGVAGFLTEESFLRHCGACHSRWAEYRKRRSGRPPRPPVGSAALGASAGNSCDSDVVRQTCRRRASQATPSFWHSQR